MRSSTGKPNGDTQPDQHLSIIRFEGSNPGLGEIISQPPEPRQRLPGPVSWAWLLSTFKTFFLLGVKPATATFDNLLIQDEAIHRTVPNQYHASNHRCLEGVK
jgi:hypothetical protein